jgi:lysine 2,3-aminomutase
MEITPFVSDAIKILQNSGWTVVNQTVFTGSSSRRGHTVKLRQILGELGVYPYYTFAVKGFKENSELFASNARLIQEIIEEKSFGLSFRNGEEFNDIYISPQHSAASIATILESSGKSFLSTDRNIINLPAVGKSTEFRVVGITDDGRRILEFDHDKNRFHSPIIDEMGKLTFIESTSVAGYLMQLSEMGENIDEYNGVFGYSICDTELQSPVFNYPQALTGLTDVISNLKL